MEHTGSRHSIFLALVLLGIFSQIVQAWLIRESLVVFYGNEVSLGAFFGSWLLWIALGSLIVAGLRDRTWVTRARTTLAWILLSLPLLLLLQVAAVRAVRGLFDIPSIELVPLGDLLLSLSLITLPTSLALGLAFPLACRALAELPRQDAEGGVSRLYVLEALGALVGGVLFTFVLIQWLGLWRSLGGLMLVMAFGAVWLHRGRIVRWAGALLVLLGAGLAFTPMADYLHSYLERVRLAGLQPGLEFVDSVETRYGHVALARFGSQTSVVRDGQISESFPQRRAMEQTAAYVYAQAEGARRLLRFGGYADGLSAELLRYPLERLDQVEQDPKAFARIRPHLDASAAKALDDPRMDLRFSDGRAFLHAADEQDYDLVLALNAVPTSAHSNRYFTREFYLGVRRVLAPDGVFCTQVSSASNYLGGTVSSYTGSVYRTLNSVFPHVAIMPGDVHTYCAAVEPGRVSENPYELIRRYENLPLDEHRFPSASFHSLLPAERIQYVRSGLQQEAADLEQDDLNRDTRPVTYYLNMLLWGQYSASGFTEWLEQLRRMGVWPYLVPVLVFLSVWLLRVSLQGFQRPHLQRQAAVFTLAVLGMVAMAVQLNILFSYQAQVGFMFERVALLNALFMTGLALGTGLIGRHLARGAHADLYLLGLLLLVAGAMLGLAPLVEVLGQVSIPVREAIFLGLSILFGLLTGVGFPLGVAQTHRDTGEITATSGFAEAADSLGGALGGLLTGALLVPLLGVRGTGELLAILCLTAMPPLLFARYLPVGIPGLSIRGGRAFPWAWPGWFLAFAVLTLFGWHLLEQGTGPAPQLSFDEHRLVAVSGSNRFQAREEPYPLYLGWDQDTPPDKGPNSVSLSSMAVAADVRGYAGPLNLLVAIDQKGLLRGVSYVDSDETPSYIHGIEQWLDGLRGMDLASRSLSLEQVDALSGATLSSEAALQAVNRSVRAGGQQAFGTEFALAPEEIQAQTPMLAPRFLVTLLLLAVFFPVYLSGSERLRLLFQAASLVILGFWLNSLVTEVDLVNLSRGHVSSLAENPQRWLLLGFVLVSGILFGQVWCGYLCPFGALQEFVSRLGRRLGLRSYPLRPLELRVRFVKFFLLALMLAAVWWNDDAVWAAFNPMQHLFGSRLEPWMWALAGAALAGALVYYRFWCRYLCPFGAFLALFNKVALLRRFSPRRRFEHCDLGVKEEFDIDCIHCNRCISGKDTRLH